MEYFDTHAHPHDHPDSCERLDELNISKIALMGVHPENWKDALHVHESFPGQTWVGFGLHPWFAHEHVKHQGKDLEEDEENDAEEKEQEWYTALRQHLIDHPHAFVGEIGLDKKAKSQSKTCHG